VTVHLLDANLMIALAWPQHVHHGAAHAWFSSVGHAGWATCPITELAFTRISSNPKIIPDAVMPREAVEMLKRIVAVPGHEFWADDVLPTETGPLASPGFVGHRQVTDGYWLALVRRRDGRLATFDGGVAELLPTEERERYFALLEEPEAQRENP
jgi:uncharacterized protein